MEEETFEMGPEECTVFKANSKMEEIPQTKWKI